MLIPDCKGDPDALDVIFAARPDVLNHNLETVARLQRAVRPSAGYARSLAVLARAKDGRARRPSRGSSSGWARRDDEVDGRPGRPAGVGVDIVTIGQYLRPTARPPARRPVGGRPTSSTGSRPIGRGASGIGHVEASPLTRSSYHAADLLSESST